MNQLVSFLLGMLILSQGWAAVDQPTVPGQFVGLSANAARTIPLPAESGPVMPTVSIQVDLTKETGRHHPVANESAPAGRLALQINLVTDPHDTA